VYGDVAETVNTRIVSRQRQGRRVGAWQELHVASRHWCNQLGKYESISSSHWQQH
jgi:hypothetical protein